MTDNIETIYTNRNPSSMAIDDYVGHIDRLDRYILSGWVYSRAEDSLDALELDVYFKDKRVTSVRPTNFRDDLKPFFGTAKTGFIADLSSVAVDLLQAFSDHETPGEGTAAIVGAIDVRIVGQPLSLSKELFVLGTAYTSKDLSSRPKTVFVKGELAWQFDDDFYLDNAPGLRDAGADPERHYISKGETEGRRPNRYFDPRFYADVYSDVRGSKSSLLEHYSEFGRFEGRLPGALASDGPAGGRRIVFVGHDAYAAGSQRVLLETIRWFKRHTTFSLTVLLLGPGHLTSEFAKLARCYTVLDLSKEANYIKSEVLQGTAPHLVYCNTVATGALFAGGLAAFFKNSKVLVHCHEMPGVLGEFPGEVAALVARADLWICASTTVHDALARTYAIPEARLETILPFIEPSTIALPAVPAYRLASRLRFGLSASDFVVVGSGTVYPRKGPDLFVDVAFHMLDQFPDHPLKFIWFGEGESRAELETRIAVRQRQSSIQFAGFQPESSDLVAMADVFFLPSREDPFPLVVLEAGQFGVPTVCYADGVGIAGFVADGRGLVAAERSIESAADAVQKLMLDKSLSDRLGWGAQAGVASHHLTKTAMRRIISEIHALGVPPALSIIVPNYNHEMFIDQRLTSILDQAIEDYEILILDDCSDDASLLRIADYRADHRVRLFTNDKNSGSVFSQWLKGIGLSRSELIWIAESDDYCDSDFLATLLPLMLDADLNIAFARTEVVDQSGTVDANALPAYLDRLQPGFGSADFRISGAEFVNQGFGALCAIVNASSCLLRKDVVRRALMAAQDYQMCGDWRVYLECCLHGSVAYSVKTTNYFRRHSQSTVHRIEGTDRYFAERLAILDFVVSNFYTSRYLHRKIQSEMFHEVTRFTGRFDSSFDGSCADFFARASHRAYIEQRLHICFYVHGLLMSKGGIERLFALISSALIDRGYRVSVICRPGDIKSPVYPLRTGLVIQPLDVETETGRAEVRAFLASSRVDAFIPMLSESLFEMVIGCAEGLAIPIIASEHNDPWIIEREWWTTDGRLSTFSQCRTIHLLSDKFKSSLPNALRARVQVIPNPVTPGFAGRTRRESARKRLIAVGRLAPQKQFAVLVQAFWMVAPKFPDWDLVVFGEGELRPALEDLVERLHLADRVSLPGESDALAEEMTVSDIMVSPSRFEGFGMALVEGMAAGLPGVAFSDCNGPNDIIRDEDNGLLVRDRSPEALSQSLGRLMGDPELRQRLGIAARGVALEFDYGRVIGRWEEMIRQNCSLAPPA